MNLPVNAPGLDRGVRWGPAMDTWPRWEHVRSHLFKQGPGGRAPPEKDLGSFLGGARSSPLSWPSAPCPVPGLYHGSLDPPAAAETDAGRGAEVTLAASQKLPKAAPHPNERRSQQLPREKP